MESATVCVAEEPKKPNRKCKLCSGKGVINYQAPKAKRPSPTACFCTIPLSDEDREQLDRRPIKWGWYR